MDVWILLSRRSQWSINVISHFAAVFKGIDCIARIIDFDSMECNQHSHLLEKYWSNACACHHRRLLSGEDPPLVLLHRQWLDWRHHAAQGLQKAELQQAVPGPAVTPSPLGLGLAPAGIPPLLQEPLPACKNF